MPADGSTSQNLRGVHRSTAVLRLLAEQPMRPADITRELGIPWSTVYRTISALTADGLLQRDEDSGEYRIGSVTWLLATAYLRDHPVLRVARSHLEQALTDVRGIIKLCERIDGVSSSLFTNQSTQNEIIRRHPPDQYRLPLHCASYGHVLLAYADEGFVESYLSGELRPLTPRTLTDPAQLREALSEAREQGYAVTREDVQSSVGSVAAPIFDASGTAVAAVSAVLPLPVMDEPTVEEQHVSVVVGLGWTISEALGWQATAVQQRTPIASPTQARASADSS